MALSADEILNADDRQINKVSVPEWDGHVYVRSLESAERDKWEAQQVEMRKGKLVPRLATVRASLVALAACDEKGGRLFTDAAAVQRLGKKNAAAMSRVFHVAQKLSRITDDDVDELAGNSEPGPSDDSGSD